jgi:hypothetical protein
VPTAATTLLAFAAESGAPGQRRMTETHAKIIVALLVLAMAGALAFMLIYGVDLRKMASD